MRVEEKKGLPVRYSLTSIIPDRRVEEENAFIRESARRDLMSRMANEIVSKNLEEIPLATAGVALRLSVIVTSLPRLDAEAAGYRWGRRELAREPDHLIMLGLLEEFEFLFRQVLFVANAEKSEHSAQDRLAIIKEMLNEAAQKWGLR